MYRIFECFNEYLRAMQFMKLYYDMFLTVSVAPSMVVCLTLHFIASLRVAGTTIPSVHMKFVINICRKRQ